MLRYCSVLVLIGMMATTGNSANVLVYPAYGGSHVVYFGELAKALQSRGFNVTVMTSSRLKLSTSVTEIGVQWWKYPSNIDEEALELFMKRQVIELIYNGSLIQKLSALGKLSDMFQKEEEELYSDEGVINKIKNGNFDFVVIDISVPAQLVLPYILNKPFAYFAMTCDPMAAKEPGSASYVPHPLGPYSDKMTLLERANNLLITVPLRLRMAIHGRNTDLSERYAPEKPALNDMELAARADLCFRLKDPMVETPRPSNPNMINIGSIMGRPGQPLNRELEKIVTDAKYGVVLVSFGTTFSDMPSYIIDKFLTVLGSLKETVVWKYSEILPNLPKNIIMLPWIPQNDLLAHDNIRLFVTHFGVNGFIETVYHGVPIVGFPLGVDQMGNGKVAEARGYGRVLDILSFTVGELHESVQDVLGNNTYGINIQKASAIMRSMPSGGDTAAFWIDHVIKHGSKHLRPHAQDMIWYEYLMLDVYLVFALSLWVIVKISKLVWLSWCRKSKTKLD